LGKKRGGRRPNKKEGKAWKGGEKSLGGRLLVVLSKKNHSLHLRGKRVEKKRGPKGREKKRKIFREKKV